MKIVSKITQVSSVQSRNRSAIYHIVCPESVLLPSCRYLITEYSQFNSLMPCKITVIHLIYPYAIVTKYVAIIIALNKQLFFRSIKNKKKKTFCFISFILSLTFFLPLWRSKLLTYIFSLPEELLLIFLCGKACWQFCQLIFRSVKNLYFSLLGRIISLDIEF